MPDVPARTNMIVVNEYIVPVNYDLPHPQQVEAAHFTGFFGSDDGLLWQEPSQHLYPLSSGQISQLVKVVRFEQQTHTNEVLKQMAQHKVRPALSPETLSFARAHPTVQLEHPLLMGLGSVWRVSGRRTILWLYAHSPKRDAPPELGLGLMHSDVGWHPDTHFLAIDV